MTVETFFANFGHLADAPNGVRKLRELILQLAVQGKLVPQGDSDDWDLVQLGAVVEVLDRLRKPVTKHDRKPGPYPYYGASGIVDYVSKYIFDEPLVLVGEDGAKWGCGDNTAFRIEGKTWVNNHAHVLRPNREIIDDHYLVYVLVGLDLSPYITGITVPKLNQARLVSIEFSLPPLEEQKRIVAKVDQLMALCDELEASQQKQQQGRVRLNNAALDALLTAREPDEFADHWQRISTNFDLLYDHPETIAKLRAAILQLAVQGKLVPQDPNDEPAEGAQDKVAEAELPFVVPVGWVWKPLGELTALITSGSRGWKEFYAESGATFIRSQDIKFDRLEYARRAFVRLPRKPEGLRTKVAHGDLLVTITGANVAKAALVEADPGEAYVSQHVALIRLNKVKQGPYIHKWLIGERGGRKLLLASSYGAKPGLNLQNLRELLVPLPPLEEQKRIVTKVNQLMALCDELEAKLKQAQQHSEKAMEATVRQLLVA